MTWRSGCGSCSVCLVLVKLFCLVLLVPPVLLELFPPRMSFQGSSPVRAVPREGTQLSAACTGRAHCPGRSLSGAPAGPGHPGLRHPGPPGKVRREWLRGAGRGCVPSAPELPDAQEGACPGCAFLSSVSPSSHQPPCVPASHLLPDATAVCSQPGAEPVLSRA